MEGGSGLSVDDGKSLKERLSQDADDLEGILSQVGAILTSGKGPEDPALHPLVSLLALKQQRLQAHLQRAEGYSEREKVIERLEAELRVREECLAKLQSSLKDSETLLISSIFQANQKLKSINQAKEQKVSPDDLIKYAHSISKTNAVAAPLSWQQGAPERPFPTDVEMRKGHLAKKNEPTRLEQTAMFPPSVPAMGPSDLVARNSLGSAYGSPHLAQQRQSSPGAGYPMMSSQRGMERNYSSGPSPTAFNNPHQPSRMGSPLAPIAMGGNYPPGQVGSPMMSSRPPPPYPGAAQPQRPANAAWAQATPRSSFLQPGVSPQQMSSPAMGQQTGRMRNPTGLQGRPQNPMAMAGGAMASPKTFGPGSTFGPQPSMVNPYMGGPIAANQIRQRRPQTGQRIGTPPAGALTARPTTGPRARQPAPEVETVSSDSSSSSSSENNSPS